MADALLRSAGVLEDEYGLHVIPLSVLLIQAIGLEYIGWDDQALQDELRDRFGVLGDITWERIQAIRVMHAHNAFWREWNVFEKCAAAIIGEYPIFSHAQPPEAEACAIVLDVAEKVDSHAYDPEVLSYIVAACLGAGVWYFEFPLAIVQEALLEHDRRKNIDRDFGGVAARLAALPDDAYIQDPETAVDVQVNHVLAVRKALAEYNDQAEAQAKSIPDLLRRH